MPTSAPDDDPGWPRPASVVLSAIPGYLRIVAGRRRSGRGMDGLFALRQVWLSFVATLFLFGVVLPLMVPGAQAEPARGWLVALAIATAVFLTLHLVIGRRPLDCRERRQLAASYRSRFFLRAAFAQAIALYAFVASFIVNQWWVYWAFLPFALYGLVRIAPTTASILRDQERLQDQGCDLSLLRVLRGRGIDEDIT